MAQLRALSRVLFSKRATCYTNPRIHTASPLRRCKEQKSQQRPSSSSGSPDAMGVEQLSRRVLLLVLLSANLSEFEIKHRVVFGVCLDNQWLFLLR